MATDARPPEAQRLGSRMARNYRLSFNPEAGNKKDARKFCIFFLFLK
jgi:hypothetical protein